jgi:ATP-dependent 26S proteasome regulatory subunit
MSLQRGINLRALAEKMGQCSGAEVRGICTEAGSFLPLRYAYHLVINAGSFQ